MKKIFSLFVCFLAIPVFSFAKYDGKNLSTSNPSSLGFIENKGQIVDQDYKPNPDVKYLFCSPGFNIQLRTSGFSYDTYYDKKNSDSLFPKNLVLKRSTPPGGGVTRHFHRVDIELLNCNSNPQILSYDTSLAYFNFFTSGINEGGVSNVRYYQRILYKNIYQNIDLEFFVIPKQNTALENSIGVEYNFIVHPGGKIEDIQLAYNGAKDVILKKGELLVKTQSGTFSEKIPKSFLKKSGENVAVTYASHNRNVFSFSMQNKIQLIDDLIIDPTPCLLWGTYYGGTGQYDEGYNISLDSNDNVCITGWAQSTSGIATNGEYQTIFGGGLYDVFIAKFNSSGSSLLWGTYYGGSGNSGGYGITLDASDNIYVTGWASPSGIITTVGAYQMNFGGGSFDAFVAKFSSDGTSLIWGTYYGGTGFDVPAYNLVLDSSDNILISGYTSSTSSIATAGAYRTSFAGNVDVFIAAINSTGTGLIWGTYYGGTGDDETDGIAIDSNNDIYITGYTTSVTGIATAGAFRTFYSGNYDAFVTKFNSTGTNLLWGTYYGGSFIDIGYGIALDTGNNVYVSGWTSSMNGMTTLGAFQTNHAGVFDALIAKFNPTGSNLLWGTYFGSQGLDQAFGIALDANSNVYVTGYTTSVAGITTTNAYQTSFGGDTTDAIVAKFDPTGTSLLWSTYLGGTGDEYSNSICLNSNNDVYIIGYADSSNGIATTGAYQTSNVGGNNTFVAKFSCTITGIASFDSQNAFSIFPNPNNGIFTLKLPDSQNRFELECFNALGEKIFMKKLLGGSTEIDMSNETKGIFFCRIISNEEVIYTGKIIVQ